MSSILEINLGALAPSFRDQVEKQYGFVLMEEHVKELNSLNLLNGSKVYLYTHGVMTGRERDRVSKRILRLIQKCGNDAWHQQMNP